MKHRKLKLLVGGTALIVGFLISLSPLGSSLDNLAYDLNFLFSSSVIEDSDVVLVAIDEASFQEADQPWPWPRTMHASLIEAAFKAGAKVVVLDLIFAEQTADDKTLTTTLQNFGPVVLATDDQVDRRGPFTRVVSVQPRPEFQTDHVVLGTAKLPVQSDGFVRGVGVRGARGEAPLSAAAIKALGQLEISDLSGDRRIRFSHQALETFSYYQALEPEKYLPNNAFRDKVVVVGLTTNSESLGDSLVGDAFPTPLTRWGAGYMSGVEIHARAIHSLLAGDSIEVYEFKNVMIIALIIGVIAFWLMVTYNPIRTLVPAAMLVLTVAAISIWMLDVYHVYISWPLILMPTIMVSLFSPSLHFVVAWRERNFIHKAFSSYVPEQVVARLMANPELLKPGGTRHKGTVLFLDLEGFTGLAESLSPEETIEILNRLFSELSAIIVEEGGMVDKFIGDEIMAVWGAPLADELHAVRACKAALRMRDFMASADSASSEEPSLGLRIGINSGEFVAGNLGDERKFDYTVIGDTVNIASRLEGCNRDHNTDILVGEATVDELSEAEFEVRKIGAISLKGRQQATEAYELIKANY